jgi:hypothetical protein
MQMLRLNFEVQLFARSRLVPSEPELHIIAMPWAAPK